MSFNRETKVVEISDRDVTVLYIKGAYKMLEQAQEVGVTTISKLDNSHFT